MWVLECEGDALNGKKLWLRPGKRHLFGRTSAEEGQFVIADKTVSRQHFTIEVDSVTATDCVNIKTRSRVILKDLGTKIGTLVNGVQLSTKVKPEEGKSTGVESCVLQQDRNTVTVGRYKYNFIITWVPVVFTFSFSMKEHNADPYTNLFETFGPLDIKVLPHYDREYTTHLVAKKRNTSKGLQALINGKYIVHNPSFVDAVAAAATPSGEELKSPLEEDFESNFPDPIQYLPPKGDEPTQRDVTAYEPNSSRQDMFDGYTFVFYEHRQFDNLLAPIAQGRGKALLREVIPNETTVDDFVAYVKNVAGEKGLGEFEDGSEGKGVVVVRFNPVKGAGTEWFADFGRQIAQRLDHRLVEQNEFLDAILGNDASVLRRPLEPELSGVVAPPPSAVTAMISQIAPSSQAAPAQEPSQMGPPEPPRRGRARRGARAKFTGFEDDFSVPASSEPQSMIIDAPEPEPAAESQSLFVSQNTEMELEREPSEPPETQTRTSRKRPASPIIEESEEEDLMEIVAPAAQALKRRRLERGEATPAPAPPPVKVKETPVPPKSVKPAPRTARQAKKESEVIELARQKREEAEEKERAEREAMEERIKNIGISERPETTFEEIEVRRKEPVPGRAAREDESERWEDKWNGRKNFKRFRRRGAEAGPMREKILVQLEEVKKKDFGIGDEYWEDNDSQRRNKKKDKGKGKDTQDVSQMDSAARLLPTSRPTSQSRAAGRAAQILASDLEDEFGRGDLSPDSDLEIVSPPPPLPRQKVASGRSQRGERSQTLVDKTNETHNLPASGISGSNKRAAEKVLTKPVPAKRARQTKLTKPLEEESDEDDGLKFRFKKR